MRGEKKHYVSRGGDKLESAHSKFKLNFKEKIVLDVGSSTGGFTDFALQHGAKKVIAVDSGTNQLHSSLRNNSKLDLHEKTDIRDLQGQTLMIDIILMDLSFISLREILPHIQIFCNQDTNVVAMVKPQFEGENKYKHKGIIKNETMRRDILKDFEAWVKKYFVVKDKVDSEVTGSKGNRERFYLLKSIQ